MFKKKCQNELASEAIKSRFASDVYVNYAEAANAEIDRLNDELAALRSQPTAERVWISKETHKDFSKNGVYFHVCREDGFWGADRKQANEPITGGYDYLLLFEEENRPVPPKPEPKLEVRVGKYQLDIGEIGEIFDIDEHGTCAYRLKWNWAPLVLLTLPEMQDILVRNNAVFIGEGDNQ